MMGIRNILMGMTGMLLFICCAVVLSVCRVIPILRIGHVRLSLWFLVLNILIVGML